MGPVERIKLHVTDDSPSTSAQARLRRAKPSTGIRKSLRSAASPVPTSGGLQTYISEPINKVVYPSQVAYICLSTTGPDIGVYGVTAEYHRNI